MCSAGTWHNLSSTAFRIAILFLPTPLWSRHSGTFAHCIRSLVMHLWTTGCAARNIQPACTVRLRTRPHLTWSAVCGGLPSRWFRCNPLQRAPVRARAHVRSVSFWDEMFILVRARAVGRWRHLLHALMCPHRNFARTCTGTCVVKSPALVMQVYAWACTNMHDGWRPLSRGEDRQSCEMWNFRQLHGCVWRFYWDDIFWNLRKSTNNRLAIDLQNICIG